MSSRDIEVDKSSLSYIRGRYGPKSGEYRAALIAKGRLSFNHEFNKKALQDSIKNSNPESEIQELSPSTLINALTSEKPVSSLKPLPGETPLEFARRRKLAKQNSN